MRNISFDVGLLAGKTYLSALSCIKKIICLPFDTCGVYR
jgi:hypothetical protein